MATHVLALSGACRAALMAGGSTFSPIPLLSNPRHKAPAVRFIRLTRGCDHLLLYLTASLTEGSVRPTRPNPQKLKSGDKNGKTTLHDRLLARFDLTILTLVFRTFVAFGINPPYLGIWVLMTPLAFPPRVSFTALRSFFLLAIATWCQSFRQLDLAPL